MTIIIILAIALLTIALVVLIALNFGGEKTNQILIKVGSLIAAAVILLSYDIFSANSELSKSVKIFIPENEYSISVNTFYKKLRYQNPEHAKGYGLLDSVLNLTQKSQEYEEVKIRDLERIVADPELQSERDALNAKMSDLQLSTIDRTRTLDRNGDEYKKQLTILESRRADFDAKIKNLRTGEDSQYRDGSGPSLDFLELAFWVWLSKKYPNHWQVDYIDDYGISGWGGSSISASEGADTNPRKITQGEMRQILKYNIFAFDEGVFQTLALPKGTEIVVTERKSSRSVFEIKTGNLTLKVTIVHTGRSPLKGTRLGDKIILENPDLRSTEHFRINFETKLNRLRIFSPETKRQQNWIKELQQNFYNDFDWSAIKPDIEKAYLQ